MEKKFMCAELEPSPEGSFHLGQKDNIGVTSMKQEKMELVDRLAIFKEINRRLSLSSIGETIETQLSNTELLAIISTAPIIEAEPVRHGCWIEVETTKYVPAIFYDPYEGKPPVYYDMAYFCDQCGREADKKEPYCHCGAKMKPDAIAVEDILPDVLERLEQMVASREEEF